jgi:hypothetical protein
MMMNEFVSMPSMAHDLSGPSPWRRMFLEPVGHRVDA